MPKLIDNKTLDPYQNILTFIRKEKTITEENGLRKYYTILSYQKDYNAQQRLGYLQRYFGRIFSSWGLAIFQAKTWRYLGKAFGGRAVKQVMILKPRLKVEVVALNSALYPQLDPSKLSALQTVLDQKGIPLNCQNPPALTQRNEIRQTAIDAYLAKAKEQRWWRDNHEEWYALKRKLFQSLDKITFEHLQSGLASCCEKLNVLLKNQKYAVGFVPKKSQHWIAELALPLLNQPPETAFQNATELSVGVSQGCQSSLNSNVKHFVIFDDASYSGSQLITTITALRWAVLESHGQEKCHLYLVVPFISDVSRQWVEQETKQSPMQAGHLKVHLITTDKKIKSMTPDVLTNEEFWRLVTIENSMHIYLNGRTPSKCLTFLEWKIADSQSIPLDVIEWYKIDPQTRKRQVIDRFITNYPPPYRTS